jgi:spermidine synthase
MTQSSRIDKATVYIAAFLSGFITMALEMLIGRTFIPYFGGTIYTWGALIGIYLTGMSIGFVLGGKASDRNPSMLALSGLFLTSSVVVTMIPFLADPVIIGILDSINDVRYAALAASLGLACLPAGLLAAVSPYCVRLLVSSKDESGTVSGRISGLSTAGSILGTIGTTFLLIPNFGVKSVYVFLSFLSLATGCIFLCIRAVARLGSRKVPSLFLLFFLVMAPLIGTFFVVEKASAQGLNTLLLRNDGLLEQVDSEYNTILIRKRNSSISMEFGYRSNRYVESAIDLMNPDELVVLYTRYMSTALAYTGNTVSRIALVGLGGGRTVSYFLASIPQAIADVAELDPAVIGLAQKYFSVVPSKRLQLHNKDGRVFLAQTKTKYDLLLIDAYRGPFVPFHLTTREFYLLAKERLNKGGVVAQNVEPTTMLFDSTYATMKSVFENVDAFEADGNVVLVAYAGRRPGMSELEDKASSVQERLRLRYDLRGLVKKRFDVRVTPGARVLTDDFAPVEMLKTVERHNERMR